MIELKNYTIADLSGLFNKLEQSVNAAQTQVGNLITIVNRQNKMLEVALDVLIDVAQDNTAELRIRRKLLFALQQIKGSAAS